MTVEEWEKKEIEHMTVMIDGCDVDDDDLLQRVNGYEYTISVEGRQKEEKNYFEM